MDQDHQFHGGATLAATVGVDPVRDLAADLRGTVFQAQLLEGGPDGVAALQQVLISDGDIGGIRIDVSHPIEGDPEDGRFAAILDPVVLVVVLGRRVGTVLRALGKSDTVHGAPDRGREDEQDDQDQLPDLMCVSHGPFSGPGLDRLG